MSQKSLEHLQLSHLAVVVVQGKMPLRNLLGRSLQQLQLAVAVAREKFRNPSWKSLRLLSQPTLILAAVRERCSLCKR